MEVFTDTVPYGAFVQIFLDEGGVVWYVDSNLQFRPYYGYKGHARFIGNAIPNVDDTMISFLIDALKNNDPEADVIRHYRYSNGDFLLCSIRNGY
jgi:hypothetical protein